MQHAYPAYDRRRASCRACPTATDWDPKSINRYSVFDTMFFAIVKIAVVHISLQFLLSTLQSTVHLVTYRYSHCRPLQIMQRIRSPCNWHWAYRPSIPMMSCAAALQLALHIQIWTVSILLFPSGTVAFDLAHSFWIGRWREESNTCHYAPLHYLANADDPLPSSLHILLRLTSLPWPGILGPGWLSPPMLAAYALALQLQMLRVTSLVVCEFRITYARIGNLPNQSHQCTSLWLFQFLTDHTHILLPKNRMAWIM